MRTAKDYRQAGKEQWRRMKEQTGIDISYLTFQNIIYGFNDAFREQLIETGMKGKYPWGIGDFVINKYKKKKIKMGGICQSQ